MNRQEAFDKAAVGVIKQGKPAFERGRCVYKAADGSRCAVGHLLPDSLGPGPFQHPGGVTTMIGQHPEVANALGVTGQSDLNFLTDLQGAHDDARWYASFVPDYTGRMHKVAAHYGLNPAVLDEPIPA